MTPADAQPTVTGRGKPTRTIASSVAELASSDPNGVAFFDPSGTLTWSSYNAFSTELACQLVGAGAGHGERVAVLVGEGALPHLAFLAAEKAGLVVVGVGSRAGYAEIRHLVSRTGATVFLTTEHWADGDAVALLVRLARDGVQVKKHLVVQLAGASWTDGLKVKTLIGEATHRVVAPGELAGRSLGPEDLFLLNSTSGTTGLPKCVMHTEQRWIYFHELAAAAGDLTGDDVFMSLLPAPFGFGLWTAHFTPTLLGAPTVLLERFSPTRAIDLIAEHRVSVLGAVTTQFVMMLNTPSLDTTDLGSLRVLFTGGEAVPFERAQEFEDRTGARVLQFYGSNETGALSRTALTDSRDRRLHTAGHVIEEMQVRLLDAGGSDVTATGGPGQAACRGPATAIGYYDDPGANDILFTSDGWMRTGDIATVDAEGYLTVVGRTSDVVIRGGKNISAAQLEADVGTHPAVAMVAVVAAPDDIYGERVCAFATLLPGFAVTLEELRVHLEGRSVSKEALPEYLVILEELPIASGGKVAKSELRRDIRDRLAAELPTADRAVSFFGPDLARP